MNAMYYKKNRNIDDHQGGGLSNSSLLLADEWALDSRDEASGQSSSVRSVGLVGLVEAGQVELR